MKASVIVSVYKNTEFLRVVLDSLRRQTEKDFEIIISEDGEDAGMRAFVESYAFENPMQHLTQADLGWRKNTALNRAIAAARAEQLIFIDGDVVLHRLYVEQMVRHFREDRILAGKRIYLNAMHTDRLLADSSYIEKMQGVCWRALLRKDGMRRTEEGVYVPWLHWLRPLNHLLGCNMSFGRKALIAINGFDEDYVRPAYGEDADLDWRFRKIGMKHFSMRNLAVQYHLDHPLNWTEQEENLRIAAEKVARNEWRAVRGLDQWL